MTVLGRGLVFQPVLVTQTCTYNSNNIALQNIGITDFPSRNKNKSKTNKQFFFKEHTNSHPNPQPALKKKKKKKKKSSRRSHDTSECFDVKLGATLLPRDPWESNPQPLDLGTEALRGSCEDTNPLSQVPPPSPRPLSPPLPLALSYPVPSPPHFLSNSWASHFISQAVQKICGGLSVGLRCLDLQFPSWDCIRR